MNTDNIIAADETKYIINQDFLEFCKIKENDTENLPNLIVCKAIYLGINDSVANYIEVDKDTVDECEKYLSDYIEAKKSE